MNWGNLINQLLEHMTQSELAERSTYSQPFISLLRNGKRKNVSYEKGQRILDLCLVHGVVVEKQKTSVIASN